MLQCEFHLFEHSATGTKLARCSSTYRYILHYPHSQWRVISIPSPYSCSSHHSLPMSVANEVAFVGGVNHFPIIKNKSLKKRSPSRPLRLLVLTKSTYSLWFQTPVLWSIPHWLEIVMLLETLWVVKAAITAKLLLNSWVNTTLKVKCHYPCFSYLTHRVSRRSRRVLRSLLRPSKRWCARWWVDIMNYCYSLCQPTHAILIDSCGTQ